MTADSAVDPGGLVAAVGGRNKRFAVLIEGSRPAILETFAERVREPHGFASVERCFDRGQLEERLRIARELHDRVGEALSVGLRRLDLLEIDALPGPPGHLAVAREAVVEAMRRLLVVTSDLREPPVASLEEALLVHLESVRADAVVRLRVSGDEAWAPPAVLDEVFLIVREAARNALAHGAPELVLIGVELTVHELSAWVIDDGCGFSPAQGQGQVAAGTGLTSMRERAALIGGRITVLSTPGHGTRIELYVPLSGWGQAGEDVISH